MGGTLRITVSMCVVGLGLICGMASGGGVGPDAGVCTIQQVTRWGTLDGVTAYSLGHNMVNVGSEAFDVLQNGADHPVFASNMFRLLNGRFEHIGQAWVWHHYCSLQVRSSCATSECPNQGGCLSSLAPGCQDPHSAPRAGCQTCLGPKFEVNADSGEFAWPYSQQGQTGDLLFKRLQVHNDDLGIAGALYFVEGQLVSRDDSSAGNQDNNASYRRVSIGPAPSYFISFVAGEDTHFERPAIYAWSDNDPNAVVTQVPVPVEGLFLLGRAATDNGDGTWHYEYALQNLNSDRSAGSFSLPLTGSVELSNIGFHDVDYHSGEPFDGTDWIPEITPQAVSWSTDQTFEENHNANALRWGTLYNFRFDANAPPTSAQVTIGLFKPGSPSEIVVPDIVVPGAAFCLADLDGDGVIGVNDLLDLLAAWGTDPGGPPDLDGDGSVGVNDLLALLAAWGPC